MQKQKAIAVDSVNAYAPSCFLKSELGPNSSQHRIMAYQMDRTTFVTVTADTSKRVGSKWGEQELLAFCGDFKRYLSSELERLATAISKSTTSGLNNGIMGSPNAYSSTLIPLSATHQSDYGLAGNQ